MPLQKPMKLATETNAMRYYRITLIPLLPSPQLRSFMTATFPPMAKFYFLFLALLLLSLLPAAFQSTTSSAHRCRVDKLKASYPSNTTVSDVGVIEKWDEEEDQMRCAGVTALRIHLSPQGLSLPNFDPVPRISYIIQGQALVGISYPWCPTAFHSDKSDDQYQKIQRVKKGDVVAVPPGLVHWCYNDGDEELVAITIVDLNSALNQLDAGFKTIYLAGDMPGFGERQNGIRQTNIMAAFNTEVMAEATGIPVDLMRLMQRKDERGVLVKVNAEEMSTLVPDKETEDSENEKNEGVCSIRLMQEIDRRGDADVFSRNVGWLNTIDERKFSLLGHMDLSAEKGSLQPNAFLAPHWSTNAHTVIYVTQGEAYLQVVDDQGRQVFNNNIKEGQLTIVPQNYASMMRARSRGIDWISFKTSSLPMRSSIIGHLSTFTALPVEVMANSYGIPITQAFELKFNREHDMMLFPPKTPSY